MFSQGQKTEIYPIAFELERGGSGKRTQYRGDRIGRDIRLRLARVPIKYVIKTIGSPAANCAN